MGSYNLIQDYTAVNEPQSVTATPYWLIAVVRFAYPLALSRKKAIMAKDSILYSDLSFTEDKTKVNKTRGSPLLIDSDCVRLTITSPKGNHISNMQAVLVNSGYNYLNEIMPDDWVMAWVVNSKDKFRSLKKRIKDLKPANRFDDGLKFVGRIHDMGETLLQSQEGFRTLQFNLQAVGFSELNSSVFYDPNLARNSPSIAEYLQRLSININSIFKAASGSAQKGVGGIDSNVMIPTILKLLLGDGIPPSSATGGGLDLATGLVSTKDSPYAYVIPNEIGKLLGQVKSKEVYTYADILDLLIGLQKYSDPEQPLFPDGTTWKSVSTLNSQTRHYTGYPIKGLFIPISVNFSNKPVWEIVKDFLNPVVNEMYTAMKYSPPSSPSEEGKILPTMVVRQLPFNTPMFAAEYKEQVTSFMELPRWVGHPVLMRSMDIGRTAGTKFNFLHVYGQSSMGTNLTPTDQIIRNPPLRTDMDIKRTGLKPYMPTVNCSFADLIHGPREWMSIISDFLMGQQFTLNGSCAMQGIVSPICPGDNFEFMDSVYHIESVTHNCSVSGDGKKTFVTSLSLSHGIRQDLPVQTKKILSPKNRSAEYDRAMSLYLKHYGNLGYLENNGFGNTETILKVANEVESGQEEIEVVGDEEQNPDLFVYSAIQQTDNRQHDPGTTSDYQDDLDETDE